MKVLKIAAAGPNSGKSLEAKITALHRASHHSPCLIELRVFLNGAGVCKNGFASKLRAGHMLRDRLGCSSFWEFLPIFGPHFGVLLDPSTWVHVRCP